MSRFATVAAPAEGPHGGGDIPADPDGYWQESERPFVCLVFLLPLIVVYEAGTRFFTDGALHGREQQIIAFILLRQFFSFFGAEGRHLPALAAVGILLAWHIARNDRWSVRPQTLAGMAVESTALAFPVLGLGYALSHYFPLAARGSGTGDYLILALGAGVYEELVFRLILFTFLSLVLRDAFQISAGGAGLLMVVLSAVLFSLYHYLSPYESFHVQTFTFRTLAGLYFGVVFLTRGFGITAASHAAYDVLIVTLSAARN
jgi:membrane protease YdiL (CAAX protease family)